MRRWPKRALETLRVRLVQCLSWPLRRARTPVARDKYSCSNPHPDRGFQNLSPIDGGSWHSRRTMGPTHAIPRHVARVTAASGNRGSAPSYPGPRDPLSQDSPWLQPRKREPDSEMNVADPSQYRQIKYIDLSEFSWIQKWLLSDVGPE